MSQYYLRLIGVFDLQDCRGKSVKIYSDKVRGILAFLYMNRKTRVARDTLAKLFWPRYSDESARVNLRRALSEVRKTFPQHVVIESDHRTVRWVAGLAGVSSDIDDLRTVRDEVERHPHRDVAQCVQCQSALKNILSLTGGGFCRSLNLSQCEDFDRWRLGRERHLADLLGSLSDQVGNVELWHSEFWDPSPIKMSDATAEPMSDTQVQAFLGAMRLSLNLILVGASPEVRSQLESLTVSSVLNSHPQRDKLRLSPSHP